MAVLWFEIETYTGQWIVPGKGSIVYKIALWDQKEVEL